MDDSAPNAIGAAYDTVAETYATLLPDTSFEDPADLAVIDRFVGMLPGPRIVDAGCGTGRMMAHLASLGSELEVSGIDLSAEMVRIARASHPGRRVDHGDIEQLPYADGDVDGVLAWYSVIHTAADDLHRPLGEFARVLTPEGAVLVAFQEGGGSRRIDNAYGHDVSMTAFLHTIERVAEVMRDVGLTPVELRVRPPRDTDVRPQGFVIGTRAAG